MLPNGGPCFSLFCHLVFFFPKGKCHEVETILFKFSKKVIELGETHRDFLRDLIKKLLCCPTGVKL